MIRFQPDQMSATLINVTAYTTIDLETKSYHFAKKILKYFWLANWV